MNNPNNLPAAVNAALPAHLQALAQSNQQLMAMNQQAAAGISTGGWPRVSIKAGYFRLQKPEEEELVVPNRYLDVIIVDTNPHGVSKRFYKGKYDPSQEGKAPDCWSDNGVGPSSRAAEPQCGTCAACPHNQWGSKISEATGKPIKACTDLKKVAVLIADNSDGPVFELDIPADSMSGFAQYVNSLSKHGIPLCTVVTRVSFDPNASYPKLIFQPCTANGQLSYITAQQLQDVQEVLGSEEADQCTGKNDVPVDASRVVAPPAAPALPAPQAQPAPMYGVPPQPVGTPIMAAHAAPPVPAAPVAAPLPQQPVYGAAIDPHAPVHPQAVAMPAQPPSTVAGTPPAPAKRTRKKVADAPAQQPLPMAAPPQPAFITGQPVPPANPAFQHPPAAAVQPAPAMPAAPQAANATAPLAPTGVTNASLDELINAAMRA